MSVLTKDSESDGNVLYVKGAPDYVLKDCKQMLCGDGNVYDMD